MKESEFTYKIISRRLTMIVASLFAGICLIVLFGWYSGLMFLTRFSPEEVSMAPSTAYAFIGLAAGLWFCLRPKNVILNRRVAISCAAAVICSTFGLFVTNIFKYYSEWEYVFVRVPETHLGFPLGHMSLVTALLFIFSGFALLFLQSERKTVRNYSSILTVGMLIFSSILLLGYGFGNPFFYTGSFIPPASLTDLSFLLVSLGLIAASDKDTLFVKIITRRTTSARLLRVFLPTILVFMVIEGLIVVRIVPLFNINPAIGISLITLIVLVAVSFIIPTITTRMGSALDAALKNLSEREETLRGFMDSATDGFMLFDSELNQVDINDAAVKMIGQKKEAVIGKNILQLVPNVETTGRYGKYKEVLRSGTPIIIDDLNLHPESGHKHVSLKAFRVGSGLGMIITDITERRTLEKVARKAQIETLRLLSDSEKSGQILLSVIEDVKLGREEIDTLNKDLEQRVVERTMQLEAANKELEAFSYSVSHDLRAPLRHINGYVDLLTNRFPDSMPEKGLHYLSCITDSASQMGLLIDALLKFSRTGRQELKQTNIEMNILFQEVLEAIKLEISERKIKWITSPLPNVLGDYTLLTLVWYNLLSNAVKFTEKVEKARIEIGFQEDTNEFVFFVRDNGVGFDMQYAHKLFGVFQRLHSSEEYEGTGIGLANVQRIILRHGGRIWAEAELGKGATFYFSLKKNKEIQ